MILDEGDGQSVYCFSPSQAWQHCVMVTATLSLLLFVVLALTVCNRNTSTRLHENHVTNGMNHVTDSCKCSSSRPWRDVTTSPNDITRSPHITNNDGLLGATVSHQSLEANLLHIVYSFPWQHTVFSLYYTVIIINLPAHSPSLLPSLPPSLPLSLSL